MYCSYCGSELSPEAYMCPNCCHPLKSQKNKWLAILLILLFGPTGGYQFYLGKIKLGVVQACIFIFGTILKSKINNNPSIWWYWPGIIIIWFPILLAFFDLLMLLFNRAKDGKEKPILS